MTKELNIVDARRSKVLVKSGFKGYDICINPYVGCQFGCSYCYVRFFIKDDNHPWGQFVRRRVHIQDKLVKELPNAAGKRIVLGTMTDPYQPVERQARITRAALEILNKSKATKVGIFTRSPIVEDDIDIISKLPRARVHFSITPFDRETMKRIEGIPVQTKRRWKVIKNLKDAGIRIHVNVAPAIPIISDKFIDEYCKELVRCGVDEFFVDPMQTYSNSFQALSNSMKGHHDWPEIYKVMTDKERFEEWKTEFRDKWIASWKKVGNSKTLAIWSDHVHKVWMDMNTGEEMDHNLYGDDLVTLKTKKSKTA